MQPDANPKSHLTLTYQERVAAVQTLKIDRVRALAPYYVAREPNPTNEGAPSESTIHKVLEDGTIKDESQVYYGWWLFGI